MAVLLTEADQLLAGRCVGSLLEVRVKTREEVARTLGDTIGLVGGLRPVCGVVLLVEIGQGVEEASRDAVLVVKLNGTLDRSIANDVSMSKVLGDDSCPGLLLLCDLVGITVGVGGVISCGIIRCTGRGRNGDVGCSKLCVVQEQRSLGSSLLLKVHGCGLGLALSLDIEAGNLSAEAEKVTNLLIVGLSRDVLNVDSCGRHDVWFRSGNGYQKR